MRFQRLLDHLAGHATAADEAAEAPTFSSDLGVRLELVRNRVAAEANHLDQLHAVASCYAGAVPRPLRLVR